MEGFVPQLFESQTQIDDFHLFRQMEERLCIFSVSNDNGHLVAEVFCKVIGLCCNDTLNSSRGIESRSTIYDLILPVLIHCRKYERKYTHFFPNIKKNMLLFKKRANKLNNLLLFGKKTLI